MDNIILACIAEKELKQQNKLQSRKRKVLEDKNSIYELKLPDGHI